MANIAIVATGNTCLLFFSLKTLYEGSFVESGFSHPGLLRKSCMKIADFEA